MKQNIDLALRLCCADEVEQWRPVLMQPFYFGNSVVATNAHVVLRIRGYETEKYDDDDERFGMRPNIDAVMHSEYKSQYYIDVEHLSKDIEGHKIVQIGIYRVMTIFLRKLIDVSLLLCIRSWAVSTECSAGVVFHTDDNRIQFLCMKCTDGSTLDIALQKSGASVADEEHAKAYLTEYQEKQRKEAEEEERKRIEYEKSHHKIWKIYVRRTDVGYLFVEAPTEEEAFAIAEKEADEAEFDDDFEYEVDDDYEEDVDHDEIKSHYSRCSIATTEKTKYGYKFVSVKDYKHFDK